MKIAILYTGGTIGCVGNPLTPLSQNEFKSSFTVNFTPIIQSQYPNIIIDFIPFGSSFLTPTLDSTNLKPVDWCIIADNILDYYASYEAFIVLHGTDTMAWTASALSFLFTGLQSNGYPSALLNKPIIVTGSQLPLFFKNDSLGFKLLFNTDAFQNVCGAVTVANSGIPEACLYFNGTLFRGNRSLKTSANHFDAFSSPNYPNLGKYGIEFYLNAGTILPHPPKAISLENFTVQQVLKRQLEHIKTHINKSNIVPFLAFPAYYDEEEQTALLANMIQDLINQNINGIILEAYGEGNFPSGNPDEPAKGAIYQALKKAYEMNIILIDCTQVISGVVNSAAYASGSWLRQVNAVGAYDMTPIAALTKLIYLVTLRNYNNNQWDQETIAELMQTNLAGEIMEVSRLDSRGKLSLTSGEAITSLDGTASLINEPESGPVLYKNDSHGTRKKLWAPLDPETQDLPGVLYMQADCNLVFYGRSGNVLYTSNTAKTGIAAPLLILKGERLAGNIELLIYDYETGDPISMIYPDF